MSNVKFTQKPISELMDLIGEDSNLTKSYIDKHTGEYPVFSATLGVPYGYIDTYKYTEKILAVVSYGASGKIYLMEGKYTIGRNICGLKVKEVYRDRISLDYIKAIATEQFIKKANGTKQKSLNRKMIKEVVIPIPVNEDGIFNLEEQEKIAKKYIFIERKRKILLEDKEKIKSISIDIDITGYSYKEVDLDSIFDLSQSSNGSKFTKTFIKENAGDIPVYGASKFEDEVGYGYVNDNIEISEMKNNKLRKVKVRYFEDCLTYNIDGTAGYVFYRTGRFSLSEKVKPLIIHEKYKDKLDENYLRYILQPIFRKNTSGRKGPNGENEFSKISKTTIKDLLIPIPIDEDGNFSIETQKIIADKYKKIEVIKANLCNKIDEVLKIGLNM